jgi:hypothetical protein
MRAPTASLAGAVTYAALSLVHEGSPYWALGLLAGAGGPVGGSGVSGGSGR